jgi:N-methylhydantoinase A
VSAGSRIQGPAVLEQLDSAVLVPPEVEAEVDDWLNVTMQIPEASR